MVRRRFDVNELPRQLNGVHRHEARITEALQSNAKALNATVAEEERKVRNGNRKLIP
jgi:hypothetical protein